MISIKFINPITFTYLIFNQATITSIRCSFQIAQVENKEASTVMLSKGRFCLMLRYVNLRDENFIKSVSSNGKDQISTYIGKLRIKKLMLVRHQFSRPRDLILQIRFIDRQLLLNLGILMLRSKTHMQIFIKKGVDAEITNFDNLCKKQRMPTK